MNKDQIKGAAKEVGGKIQQEVGEAVGSPEQQLKGMKNQVEGNIQQKAGDLKEVVEEDILKDDIVKDRGNR